jgi:DNA-binding MarR family transcriptional regulator
MDKEQSSDASASPEHRLGFLVYRAGLAVSRGYERALAPLQATPTEAGLLSALAYNGPNHVRGAARFLGLGRQTVVNVTKELQACGFIERMAAPADSRLVLYAVTEAGRERLRQIEVVARAFDERLAATVGGASQADLMAMLSRIVASDFLQHED